MKRIVLFLATNLAIVLMLSLSMRLLGVEPAFFVTYIVAELVLGVLASMSVMWFSRRRGFGQPPLADRMAARGSLEFARN